MGNLHSTICDGLLTPVKAERLKCPLPEELVFCMLSYLDIPELIRVIGCASVMGLHNIRIPNELPTTQLSGVGLSRLFSQSHIRLVRPNVPDYRMPPPPPDGPPPCRLMLEGRSIHFLKSENDCKEGLECLRETGLENKRRRLQLPSSSDDNTRVALRPPSKYFIKIARNISGDEISNVALIKRSIARGASAEKVLEAGRIFTCLEGYDPQTYRYRFPSLPKSSYNRLVNHKLVRHDRKFKRLLLRVIFDNEKNRRRLVNLSDVDKWVKQLCVEVRNAGLGRGGSRSTSSSSLGATTLSNHLSSTVIENRSRSQSTSPSDSDMSTTDKKITDIKRDIPLLQDPEVALGINRMLSLLTTISRPFCISDGESTLTLSENQNLLLNHLTGKPELHAALAALNTVICESPVELKKHMMWLLVNISISLPGAEFVAGALLPNFQGIKSINAETGKRMLMLASNLCYHSLERSSEVRRALKYLLMLCHPHPMDDVARKCYVNVLTAIDQQEQA